MRQSIPTSQPLFQDRASVGARSGAASRWVVARRTAAIGLLIAGLLTPAISAQSGGGAGSLLPIAGNPWLDRGRGFRNFGHGIAATHNVGEYVEVGSVQQAGSSYDFSIVFKVDPSSLYYNPASPARGVTVDFGTGANQGYESYDWATSVAVDSQGRIVVAGYTAPASLSNEFQIGGPVKFAIARLTPAGELDGTFGDGGTVITDFGTGSGAPDNAYAYAVAIDDSDNVVVVGATDALSTDGHQHFVVARYDVNGVPDSTFGGSGAIITDFHNVGVNTAPTNDVAFAVAIDSSGRIVIAGYSEDLAVTYDASGNGHCTNGCPIEFALARYYDDGSVDTAFGSGGKVLESFSNFDFFSQSVSDDIGQSIAFDSADRIVVAGFSDAKGTTRCGISLCPGNDFAVARFLFNGTPDISFGSGGRMLTDFAGSDDEGYGVVVDSLDRIIVAGRADGAYSQPSFAVARYLVNGDLDASFSGGKVTTNMGVLSGGSPTQDLAAAVMIDEVDRIVVAGSSSGQFAQVQYLSADADLNVTASASPSPVPLGGTVRFGSIVTNLGPEPTSAFFEDVLPAGFGYIGHSGSVSQGTCNIGGGGSSPFSVNCALGTIAPGGSVTISFQAVANVVGDVTNTARVRGSDPQLLNNTATAAVTVNPVADLAVNMTGAPNPVSGGGDVTYTMTVRNSGPSDATGVMLTDQVLDKASSVSFTQGSCGITNTNGKNGTTVLSCGLGMVPSGGTAIVTLVVKAPHKKGTIMTNTASVSATEADPNANNNSATATVMVQ